MGNIAEGISPQQLHQMTVNSQKTAFEHQSQQVPASHAHENLLEPPPTEAEEAPKGPELQWLALSSI